LSTSAPGGSLQGVKPSNDYSLLSDETVHEFQQAFLRYEESRNLLLDTRDEQDFGYIRAVTLNHLKAYDVLAKMAKDVKMESLVLPALVHVAGEPREEEDGSWSQDCDNCGSWLARWSPGMLHTKDDGASYEVDLDEFGWWPDGQLIAKSDHGLWVVGYECNECGGGGRKHGDDCPVCEGEGFVERDLRPGEALCVGKAELGWDKD